MTLDSSQKTGHEIVTDLVYGPVTSRRYGKTLGINLLPQKKFCSFNCVYCQLGWNDKTYVPTTSDFPSQEAICGAFQSWFQASEKRSSGIEAIVLSGNGEPTSHPHFAELIDRLIRLRNNLKKQIPIVCLTNGAGLLDDKIFQALTKIDECCVKLDARYLHTNLPDKNIDQSKVLERMSLLKNLVIQSCFFDGVHSNTGDESVQNWLLCFKNLHPKRVDLYTVSRQTAAENLVPTDENTLHQISKKLHKNDIQSIRIFTS